MYLSHAISIALLNRFYSFESLRSRSMAIRIAALICCLLTIFGIALVIYHMVERPFRDVSRRLMGATSRPETSPKEAAASVDR
jgi:peptidoglycan/LPS O-acetylase OafA/YrhL